MSRGPRQLFWPLAVALAAVCVATLWVVDYLPTHDGPQHLAMAYLDAHFDDEGGFYPRIFTPQLALTARGFAAIYDPFAALLPWRTALRATLSLIVLLWFAGFVTLVHVLAPKRRWLGLLAAATALHWSLYMGFFPYCVASGLAFFVLALALHRAPSTRGRGVMLSCLLLATTIAHLFVGAVVGLALICIALAAPGPRGRWRSLLRLVAVGAPSLLIAALPTVGSSYYEVNLAVAATEWLPLVDRLAGLADTFVSGPPWRSWPLVLLAAVGLASGGRAVVRGTASAADKGVWVTSVVLMAIYLALPLHAAVWEFLAPRPLPLAIMLAVALVPLESLGRRARLALQLAIVALCLVSCAWSFGYHRQLRRMSARALAALDTPLPTGVRMPVIFQQYVKDDPIPHHAPFRHLGVLYMVAHGGIVPTLFAGMPFVHNFKARRRFFRYPRVYPPRYLVYNEGGGDPRERRAAAIAYVGIPGAYYDDIMVYGPPAAAEALIARGYRPRWHRDGLLFARFEGCRAAVLLPPAPSPAGGRGWIEYGWPAAPTVTTGRVPLAGKTAARAIALARLPCGEAWLRVYWDRDRSGKLSARDAVCANSKAGVFRLATRRGTRPVVRCERAGEPASFPAGASP